MSDAQWIDQNEKVLRGPGLAEVRHFINSTPGTAVDFLKEIVYYFDPRVER